MCSHRRRNWRIEFDATIPHSSLSTIVEDIVRDVETLTEVTIDTVDHGGTPLAVELEMPEAAALVLQQEYETGAICELGRQRIADATLLPYTDDQLLSRWREHDDREAGEELMMRYYEDVYDFFSSKISTDVADLVQNTFLACVKNRDTFARHDDARFKTWLFGIAKHKLYEHYRCGRRMNSRYALTDPAELTAEELGHGPSTWLRERFDRGLINTALDRIATKHRLLIEFYLRQDYNFRELSQIMGIPENTVRSRFRRAKLALAKKVEELCRGPIMDEALRNIANWPDRPRPQ